MRNEERMETKEWKTFELTLTHSSLLFVSKYIGITGCEL